MNLRHRTWRRLAGIAGAAAIGATLVTVLPAVSPAAARTAGATVSLVGAGSTFDNPFFALAFAEYGKAHPVNVNYQAIGSGGGIKQFIAGTVDFGATDVPMSKSELSQAQASGGATVQIPVALGGVAIIYTLPEMSHSKRTLRLDGDTLSQIFQGKITKWNDKAIAALNPGVALPALNILPVHRSDSSGTTYILTDYLSSVSSDWANNVGKGKSVAWPSGLGGKGNPGIAAIVNRTAGAIGYVELAYALQNNIPFMALKNKAGSFQLPSQATVRAAAAQFPTVSAQNFSIVNAPGAGSYPIAGYSWVLLRQHPHAHASDLVSLFRWTVTSGQQYAGKLNYVPLPDNVQKVATSALSTIK